MINIDLDRSPQRHIPVSSPDFRGNERKYLSDCLDRGWITQGPFVREFEEEFARIYGTKHAIACSSGTAALHLALLALDLRPDDSVIVPALTYVATANAARYCGARVYFCDVDPESWCISEESRKKVLLSIVARHLREKSTAGIITIPVHLYDSLAEFNSHPEVTVVDSSHVLGKQPVGRAYRLATHSFYASKIIACGEGGAITTNDDDLAERIRLFRGQGATTPGRYHHSVIGYNYRMTDLQAAIGLAQLERLDEFLAIRRDIINHYRSRLVSSPITLQGGQRASGWSMAVLVPEMSDRDKVADSLLSQGVETRPFFEPLPSLPMYRKATNGEDYEKAFPIATNVAKRGLCLPTHTRLSLADVDYVCDCLLGAVK